MPVADAGLMRERVALLRQVPTVDAHNQPVEDWRTVAHVWAAIRPLTSRELLVAGQQTGQVQYEVTLRYGGILKTLDHTDRLVWMGKTLYLEQPRLDDVARVWTALAREKLL